MLAMNVLMGAEHGKCKTKGSRNLFISLYGPSSSFLFLPSICLPCSLFSPFPLKRFQRVIWDISRGSHFQLGNMAYRAFDPHPFDPISGVEIKLAVELLNAAFPGSKLRFKRIDVREPLKNDTIPYLEAERLGHPPPQKPPRLLFSLFHRLSDHAFFKATIDVGKRCVLEATELARGVQVRYRPA